jgi:hypothetical protein
LVFNHDGALDMLSEQFLAGLPDAVFYDQRPHGQRPFE